MGRWPRLSLRGRLSLLTALAVAVAVAACAVGSWFLVRGQLYGDLDRRLAVISGSPDGMSGRPVPRQRPREGRRMWELDAVLQRCTGEATSTQTRLRPPGPYDIMQVVRADGGRCTVPNAGALTVDTDDARVAGGELPSAVHNGTGVTADGDRVDVRVHTRAFTAPDGTRAAVSIAVGLSQVEEPLADLALALAAVTALGVLVSAGTGLLIARASLRPVDELTAITERIARTQDLGTPIPVDGADEIARLSRSFNTMTDALAASRDHQRQLIADAGHELRTPLTSLRTNVDLLLRAEATGRDLPAATRHKLLVSVKAQMLELSSLVGDLLELSRPEDAAPACETVALHEAVTRAVERVRPRGPGLTIEADTEPWYVIGDPASLERAVVNLLDNAVKFSPPGGTVRVRLTGGELTVHDHGPGIPDEDLPHVFERFWRSPSARSLPGSGLGLSIVARAVDECGGTVRLDPAPGGTLARMYLPGTPDRLD